MAPLFASRIARICINGTVSAGHDISDMFQKQVKKWKLTDREQAEVMQLLSDMGYPLREDRGYMPDEEVDVTSSDNYDWSAQYSS
jgi:ubiquitin C-terminal hydrolase